MANKCPLCNGKVKDGYCVDCGYYVPDNQQLDEMSEKYDLNPTEEQSEPSYYNTYKEPSPEVKVGYENNKQNEHQQYYSPYENNQPPYQQQNNPYMDNVNNNTQQSDKGYFAQNWWMILLSFIPVLGFVIFSVERKKNTPDSKKMSIIALIIAILVIIGTIIE